MPRPYFLRRVDFPYRSAIALTAGCAVWLAIDPIVSRLLP